MNLLKKISPLGKLAKWRLSWRKYDRDYKPGNIRSQKFISAREAAAQIPDNATCASSGMGSNGRCSIFFWAIREAFLSGKSPANLTWVTVSAQGSRGKAPGTLEELDPPGLIATYISGHLESAKALLKQAAKGHIELHTMPQGELAFLLEAQGNGRRTITSKTGVNTFLDPRTGNGSQVTPSARNQYISVPENDPHRLQYEIPPIEFAMLSAPYADPEGKIYFKHASAITENMEVTRAAKANGGRTDEKESLSTIKFVNETLGIYPKRSPVDDSLCRAAGLIFTWVARKYDSVNLGTGMPEEVGRLIYEGGIYKDLTFSCESGVYGGIPASGIYFGAAVNPLQINSSAWIFRQYKENLDVTVLGFLQVDTNGNVNVSRRGTDVEGFVGPGGFPTICESAKTIIFVGTWMARSKMALENGNLTIQKPGIPKFVEQVDEVTFNGQEAIKQGKTVLYVTNVGVFQLTEKGLELTHITPGIDLERDIRNNCKADFHLTEEKLQVIPRSLMTGKGFKLSWNGPRRRAFRRAPWESSKSPLRGAAPGPAQFLNQAKAGQID